MEVKVYASKGTLGVLTVVCLILTGVFLYLGIGKSGQENYDMYLLSAMFAFAFAVVFLAFMLPKGMVQNIVIGVSMLLIGIAGIFLFFISGNMGALYC